MTSEMTLDEVEEMITRQAQAWIDEDMESALVDFAPDAIFQSPGGRWQGHEQIRQAAGAFFEVATNVEITVTRLIFDGRQGAVEWTWREESRKTGQRHGAEDAIVFEIENGKIVYWREYFDTAEMAKVIPA